MFLCTPIVCNEFLLLTLGLQILFTLLQNVAQEEAAAQSFYQTYFCDILQHIFSVVTDTSHTAGKS
jgi:exportin-1